MNIEDPSWFEKAVGTFKGENRQAMFDMAAEDVANALEIEMAALQKQINQVLLLYLIQDVN